MKRVREIDLEAPVPEDDDGEDDGDGEDTCTSAWDARAFTKKSRLIHEIPQQGHKAEKQPRDPTIPYGTDTEKYQNSKFLDFNAQHHASKEIDRLEQTTLTAKLRTVAPIDLQVPTDSDRPKLGPQVDHKVDTFDTPENVPELRSQLVGKDTQMTNESAQGGEKPVSMEHFVQLKEEKRTFCSPPAVLLYSIDDRQDTELHSVLQKYGALLSQPDRSVRLEGICFIGQYISLIKENNTRKAVTKMIQQQLWIEDEPSVIEAIVKVLCSVVRISCEDNLAEDNNFDWPSHVARLLLHYIINKKGESSPLKSDLKLQVLRSLYLVGKAGAILELESVWPLAKEQLASPNPRLREYGIRVLVQSIKEIKAGDGRNSEETKPGPSGNVQKSRAEGESLMHTLLEYTRDPYPNVREAVVCCVLNLHSKGFALKHSTYKVAVALLRDKFESVRICAIKLVGVWAKATAGDGLPGPESKHIDNAFLQICNMVTDMTMNVRQEACNVLAEMTGVSENALLQSLTKKVLTSATEKGSTGEGSSSLSNGDLDVAKLEENKLLEWAAGAFVVGLEDEFWEVRSAAVMALAKLGLSSEKVAHSALELIVDMINDDSTLVRQKTIKALANLAVAGRLSVLESHLHMFLGILEDSRVVMRKGGHELLSAISLPSIATFQLTVRAIFTSLDKHPEDEKSLLVTLEKLGRSHASHTESLVNELVQELRGLLNEDLGLDEPRAVGILVLLLGAATANGKIISLIPSQIISIANLVSHKLPVNLPLLEVSPLGFKTVQYNWYATDGFLPNKNHSGDQSRDSHRKWRPADGSKHLLGLVNLESWAQEYAWDGKMEERSLNHERKSTPVLDIEGSQGAAWPSGMAKPIQESRLYKSGQQEILESTKQIVGSALGTSLLLDMKAFKVVLQRLSGCRKELKALKGRCLGLSGMVSFYELYLECLIMVVQLRANFISQESRALVKKSGLPQDVLNRLDSVLKHILHRFSGFSFEHLLHIFELHAIVYVWKLAMQPVEHPVNDGPESMIFLELRLAVTTAEKITKRHGLPPSPLLKSVLEQLLGDEGQTNILKFWRTARQLALSYWPSLIAIDSSVKETWASMKAPGSDFDHPLGFSAGLPVGIPIDITLYNVPDMYSLWIQFSQDTSAVGYKRLDVENSGMSSASNIYQLSTLLQLDEMPSVASSVCRICIVIEGDNHQRILETVGIGKGPRGCVVPICTEMEVHLYRIRERGSKQLPLGKR